jgi:membrane dipeptidase
MNDKHNDAARWGISEEAASLHKQAIVWEGIISWISMDMMQADITLKRNCLPRYLASGCDHVSLTVGSDICGGLERNVRWLARTRNYLKREHAEMIVMVDTAEDIRRAKREGKLAVSFHFQGTNPMAGNFNEDPGDTEMVSLFYDLGVRQVLLAHNLRNVAADGCHENSDAGLSAYGQRLIREMNRIGMVVDCSHTGYRSTMEAMDISEKPVVFSHSNARAIFDHPRNIADDQIKRCAEMGGVIGVCGWGPIVNAENDASVERVMEHMDHMVALVGPKHVGIGLDYVYDPVLTSQRMQQQPELYAPGSSMKKFGYDVELMQFMPPEDLPKLTQAMLDRGYPEDAILDILGGNLLRLNEQVWAAR